MAESEPAKGKQRAPLKSPILTGLCKMEKKNTTYEYIDTSTSLLLEQDKERTPKESTKFLLSLEHTKLIAYIIGLYLENNNLKNLDKIEKPEGTTYHSAVTIDVLQYYREKYNPDSSEINPDELENDRQYWNMLQGLKEKLDTIASYKLSYSTKGKRGSIGFISPNKTYDRVRKTLRLDLDQSFLRYIAEENSTNLLSKKYLKVLTDNEFILFFAITHHFEINKKRSLKNAKRLSIATLVKNLALKQYDEIKQAHSWRERIEEPLFKALERLHSIGFIVDYHQTEESKEKHGDYATAENYEDWSKAVLEFELNLD